MLEDMGVEYLINHLGWKLNKKELALMASDFDVIIAGTEQITDDVIENDKDLRLISRVGIGLDRVDFLAAERS
jgi:D-3-phosphoglycerate dehydrogenase